jgi:hypothetical protein
MLGTVGGYSYFLKVAYQAPEFMHKIQSIIHLPFIIIYASLPCLLLVVSLFIRKWRAFSASFFVTAITLSLLFTIALGELGPK